jgi:hypothetical protein
MYKVSYSGAAEDNGHVVVILAGTRANFYEELKRLVK